MDSGTPSGIIVTQPERREGFSPRARTRCLPDTQGLAALPVPVRIATTPRLCDRRIQCNRGTVGAFRHLELHDKNLISDLHNHVGLTVIGRLFRSYIHPSRKQAKIEQAGIP